MKLNITGIPLLCSLVIFGCPKEADWSTDPPTNIAQTNQVRREIGIRMIKDNWTFYGRQFGEETWKDGKFHCKKVCYDDSFNKFAGKRKPPGQVRYSYNYEKILWESDHYYTGATYTHPDPDAGTSWEHLSILYDYGTKRFGVYYHGSNSELISLIEGLEHITKSGYMGKTNEDTLLVADKILEKLGLKRL